jgi:hypothetical protein
MAFSARLLRQGCDIPYPRRRTSVRREPTISAVVDRENFVGRGPRSGATDRLRNIIDQKQRIRLNSKRMIFGVGMKRGHVVEVSAGVCQTYARW